MGAFEYTALDVRGKESKGLLEADTPRQIRQMLRDQELVPLTVEAVERQANGQSGGLGVGRSIGATDLAVLTRQLSTLVRAALPVEEALQTVVRQSEKPRLKKLMAAVRSKVLEGHTLANSLGEFPHAFPELYRTTVAAGEQSGHLDMVLERLADYTENRQQMRQKIMLALFYPAILTAVALLVTIALLTYVVPEVIRVFENIGQELPTLTVMLIAVSNFLRESGLWLLILLVLMVVGFGYLLRIEAMRFHFHRLLLGLPLVARLTRGLNTARFARTFSILTASSVPVLDALRISAEVLSSLPMRQAVFSASERVREGTPIARSLEQCGHFPPMTLHLIASGESSGRLEEMLERAATNQERELETIIAALMGIFEPLLILVMGGIVLVIVLAILLPIFDLNQLVQ